MNKLSTYKSDSFLLNYQTIGQGYPCLVIGSAKYYPQTFSENLYQHLQMTHVDSRAFAQSDNEIDEQAKQLDRVIDDIEAVRSHLNLQRPILIGHSGNAYFALQYAKKYPQHISNLVLLNAGPDLGYESQQAAEHYWQKYAGQERKEKMLANETGGAGIQPGATSHQQFIDFYVMNTPKIWFDFEIDARALWDGVYINMPVFEYLWGDVFSKIDICQELDKVSMPVFLALGDHDFITAPYSSWLPLLDKFQNITVKVFSNCGHTPQLEVPEAFDEALLQWLSEQKGK